MKTVLLFLLFCICKFSLSFNVCPAGIGAPNGETERDAAGFFPNDEVVLSDDGKKFIPYKYKSGQTVNHISTCSAYTCGRKTFPHGFHIEIISHRALMLCENHRCLNPDKIKCRKTVEHGACGNENEWVAGLFERKNETKEWLEVECCHYSDNLEPKFIKNIVISSSYNHDIVLENGTMIATDYIKDIKKVVDLTGQTVFSASIYRMKCDTKNIPENVPSVFDKAEVLRDEDGTGFFVNSKKTCENENEFRAFFVNPFYKIPSFTCLPQKCLSFDKIKCKKNITAENCSAKNEWIAGFSKHENGSYNVLNVECCNYNDTINPTFDKNIKFNLTNVRTNYFVEEYGIPIFLPLVNNITVIGEKNGTTIYSASVYRVMCNNGAFALVSQEHQQRSLQSMMSDMFRRAMESAFKNSTKGLSPEFLPILKEQKKSMTEIFETASIKAAEIKTKNSTKFFEKQEKYLIQQLNTIEKQFSDEGISLSDESNSTVKMFLEAPTSNSSLWT